LVPIYKERRKVWKLLLFRVKLKQQLQELENDEDVVEVIDVEDKKKLLLIWGGQEEAPKSDGSLWGYLRIMYSKIQKLQGKHAVQISNY
jgi:hypothetical protein